jgi:hypothetical protein
MKQKWGGATTFCVKGRGTSEEDMVDLSLLLFA